MRYETNNVNMKTTCKRRDHRFYVQQTYRAPSIVSNVINTLSELPKNCYANKFSAKTYNFNPF